MSRVEKMQGMLAVGAISTKQGKQFMFSAKKGLKQEVALLTMSAAPLSQVSGEEDHHEAGATSTRTKRSTKWTEARGWRRRCRRRRQPSPPPSVDIVEAGDGGGPTHLPRANCLRSGLQIPKIQYMCNQRNRRVQSRAKKTSNSFRLRDTECIVFCDS